MRSSSLSATRWILMTYLAPNPAVFPRTDHGMGDTLTVQDSATTWSQAINCSPNDLQATVVGGHYDTNHDDPAYTPRYLLWYSWRSTTWMKQSGKSGADTMVGGATLPVCFWYFQPRFEAVGASLVEAIVRDEKTDAMLCFFLEGE